MSSERKKFKILQQILKDDFDAFLGDIYKWRTYFVETLFSAIPLKFI